MPPRRPPKRMTHARLRRVLAHYLERYSTTSSHARRLMRQRIRRAAEHHGEDPAVAEGWLDAEIARMQELGVIDDAAYARDRARSLVRRGNGPRLVRSKLAAKGVPSDLIDAALQEMVEEVGDPAWAAALTYARKRRLGPWSRGELDWELRTKQLAKLARAGFSYEMARRVLDLTDPDDA